MKPFTIFLLFLINTNNCFSQVYLAAAKSDALWGYIDMQGKWIIEPQFSDAYLFSDGYAHVENADNSFYINVKGEMFTPGSDFQLTNDFYNGMARIKEGKDWGFMDTSFKIVIEPNYSQAKDYAEGLFPVKSKKERLWGYIDKNNNWVIKAMFDKAYTFSGGLALVRKGGYWYFINREGNLETDPNEMRVVENFSDGLAKVQINEKWGFVNKEFELVVPAQFDGVKNYTEGLCAVKYGEKWGYIDYSGKWLIDPFYQKAYEFHDGIAMVKINGTWYYVDRNFEILSWTKQYEPSHSFFNGLARINVKGGWGFVNKEGQIVIETKYNSVKNFTKVKD